MLKKFSVKGLGLCFVSMCVCNLALGAENEKPSDSLCTVEVAKLTARAKAALKAGNPDKAFQMLYECGPRLVDQEALKVKGQARTAGLKKAEANDATSTANLRRLNKQKGVYIGMTQAEVAESSWGKPRKVNRTTTANGTHEQWVYGGGYLYFEDGILTAVQN